MKILRGEWSQEDFNEVKGKNLLKLSPRGLKCKKCGKDLPKIIVSAAQYDFFAQQSYPFKDWAFKIFKPKLSSYPIRILKHGVCYRHWVNSPLKRLLLKQEEHEKNAELLRKLENPSYLPTLKASNSQLTVKQRKGYKK